MELLALDQAPQLHDKIFERNPAVDERRITRIQSNTRIPLSLARNRLLANISGEGYVVFCDDDASYPNDFLTSMRDEFACCGEWDIAVFRLLNTGETTPYGNRKYPSHSRPMRGHELINLAISLNLVMKLSCISNVGGFNEALGVGSSGLCGEETELVLKALDNGAKAVYVHAPYAYHPRQELVEMNELKLFNYSRGYRDMLLGFKGSLQLCLTVRLHLYMAVAKSAVAYVIRKNERRGRLIKLKGLLGLRFTRSRDD
ncbi:hypothetical protein CR103_09520 [Massilia psychrophila]|uniref:Glycosyltransferase 2-like domain-containing protein n=2 Tax=Massilia psychrophila TaxID=1603353 RepID=A0A2G8T1M6_9BURK|nr:hypothetical protein CR103_09520 [Massilia psychrophila]GGE78478.1 hypothetical protein GCM10008020_24040 [Massilia psychrophila]